MKTLEATSASEPIVPHAVHADAVLKSLASDRVRGLTGAEAADAINDADALMALAGLEQSDQWKRDWQTRLKPTG